MKQKSIEKAMELVKALLLTEEVSLENGKNTDLYEAYNSDAEIFELVDSMLKSLNLKVYDSNYSLYLIPGEHNRVFGYSNEELKRQMGLRYNRELYLSYFIMFQVMTVFYTDSATYTYTEYVRCENTIQMTDAALHNMIRDTNKMKKYNLKESSFQTLALLWDELPVILNEDTGEIRANRSSKAGFVKTVFNFLVAQNLFAESEERYYPTKRFHALVKCYFEEERGNLFSFLQELKLEEELQNAAH